MVKLFASMKMRELLEFPLPTDGNTHIFGSGSTGNAKQSRHSFSLGAAEELTLKNIAQH